MTSILGPDGSPLGTSAQKQRALEAYLAAAGVNAAGYRSAAILVAEVAGIHVEVFDRARRPQPGRIAHADALWSALASLLEMEADRRAGIVGRLTLPGGKPIGVRAEDGEAFREAHLARDREGLLVLARTKGVPVPVTPPLSVVGEAIRSTGDEATSLAVLASLAELLP